MTPAVTTQVALAGVAFVAIPAYLAYRAAHGDVMAAGHEEAGLASMIGGHVFEHVLDYVFVVLLSLGIHGRLGRR